MGSVLLDGAAHCGRRAPSPPGMANEGQSVSASAGGSGQDRGHAREVHEGGAGGECRLLPSLRASMIAAGISLLPLCFTRPAPPLCFTRRGFARARARVRTQTSAHARVYLHSSCMQRASGRVACVRPCVRSVRASLRTSVCVCARAHASVCLCVCLCVCARCVTDPCVNVCVRER